jgi:5,10-methenyltetrahydromethanopterin hydrogenase
MKLTGHNDANPIEGFFLYELADVYGAAAPVAAAQKMEHYENASCGCLHEWAEAVGNRETADILREVREVLEEEKVAGEKLPELACHYCHPEAVGNSEASLIASSGDAVEMGARRRMRPAARPRL